MLGTTGSRLERDRRRRQPILSLRPPNSEGVPTALLVSVSNRRHMKHLTLPVVLLASLPVTSPCRAMQADPDSDERVLEIAQQAAERAIGMRAPRYPHDPLTDWRIFADWLARKRSFISIAETNFEIVDPFGVAPERKPERFSPAVRVHVARRIGEMWADYVESYRLARPHSSAPWNYDFPFALLDNLYVPPEAQKARRAFAACTSMSTANATWTDDSTACERWLSRNFHAEHRELEEWMPLPTKTFASPSPPLPLPHTR